MRCHGDVIRVNLGWVYTVQLFNKKSALQTQHVNLMPKQTKNMAVTVY